MNKVLWAIGWWSYIAGWFGIVVWPAKIGLLMWNGVTPSAVELVPTVVIVVIGVLLVILGKYLRRRFAS
jgi:hypothetical protein